VWLLTLSVGQHGRAREMPAECEQNLARRYAKTLLQYSFYHPVREDTDLELNILEWLDRVHSVSQRRRLQLCPITRTRSPLTSEATGSPHWALGWRNISAFVGKTVQVSARLIERVCRPAVTPTLLSHLISKGGVCNASIQIGWSRVTGVGYPDDAHSKYNCLPLPPTTHFWRSLRQS
jgi:hypothetical protein